MRRSLHLRLALAALLATSLTLPAMADPPEVKISEGPGFNWATFKEAITDPKPSVGGAAVNVAFIAMWSAIGNVMAHTEFCQEANTALADTTHHQFTVKVTVVNAGGDPVGSYTQSYLAVHSAAGVAYAPVVNLPDGSRITGPIKYCPGKSGRLPPGVNNPPSARRISDEGTTRRMTHDSQYGKVSVILPGDVRAGDTISGTVLFEPAGLTQQEQMANAAQLTGYVIDVEGKRQPVADGRVLVPITQAGGMVPLVLRNAAGNPVDTMGVAAIPPEVPFVLQPVAPASQAGVPLSIPGQFDGNASNTTATLNGQPVRIIAESPRQTIVDCPPGVTGPVAVTIADPAGTATAKTNLVGISLSTPRTTLMRGEKTVVTLRVMGLEGLQRRLSVAVQASPSVRLQGGNMQTVVIDPARSASGFVERPFNLTMNAPGPFDVSARLLDPGEVAPTPAAKPQPPPRRRVTM